MPGSFYEYAASDPGRTAVTGPDGASVTYGELLRRVNRGSHALRAEGLKEGDALGLLSRNHVGYLEVALAAAQVGIRLVPVNTHLTADEATFILADSGAAGLVTDQAMSGLAVQMIERSPQPPAVRLALGAAAVEGFDRWDAATAGQPDTAPDDRVHANPMLYTSGTSGRPKGVVWGMSAATPEQAIAATDPLMARRGMEHAPDTSIVVGPLYHGAPGAWATYGLHHGHHVVLLDGWDGERFLAAVEEHRATTAQLAPIHFSRLLALGDEQRSRHDLGSLRVVSHAGAPTPVAVKRAMVDWWGPVLVEYYASSEGFGTSITSDDWLARPGSVGHAETDGCSMQIRDEDGAPLPAGEIGQVWIRNPGGVLSTYTRDAGDPPEDRYYSAGDMGYLDDDGWLFLVDRRTDMILSGGVNVYPAEVEDALRALDDVADAAVVGVPDPEWGASVVAVVVPADGREPSPALTVRILDGAGRSLARYKLPRRVEYRQELPYSPTGKLLRRVVRDELGPTSTPA